MSNLRPMQIGEILDGTFAIYRRHFRLFLKMSMLVMGLPIIGWVYLQVRYTGGNTVELMAALQDHLMTFIVTGLGIWFLLLAAGLLLKAGSIRIISASFLGEEPRLGDALALGGAKILPLLLVALGKVLLLALVSGVLFGIAGVVVTLVATASPALAVLLGIVLFPAAVWLCVFVACGYGVTTPTVVLEDLPSSFDSFGRSWDLARGARLKVFAVAAVAWLVSQFLPGMTVGIINTVLATMSPNLIPITVVLASFISIMLAPILPCAMTLLYYDLRVRREGFDLQVLSQQLGIT